ncbi:hypothetical protein ACOMHN_054573 [Nucella lapillus]
MTRAGNCISSDQEEHVQLKAVTREHKEDPYVFNVFICPQSHYDSYRKYSKEKEQPAQSVTDQPESPKPSTDNTSTTPATGTGSGGRLSSFATILAALRDIYVTTIQPLNMHELIKPLLLAAGVLAVLSFILAFILALSFSTLGGLSQSLVRPFLRQHLCGEELETAQAEIPRMYKRISELENRMSQMRQVEVGSLVCKNDQHNFEETESTTLYLPFRKTRFSDAPRVTFGLREVSMDDFHSVRLENLQVNSTGFSVHCSYFGKWMHYNMEFSWVAVGK